MFTIALFGLAELLALIGCLAGCWWFLRRREDTAHGMTVKALQRPVLLGLVLTAIFLILTVSAVVEWPIVAKFYAAEAIGSIATAKAFAGFVLAPLQTVAFVILTIVLCRRRLRLSQV